MNGMWKKMNSEQLGDLVAVEDLDPQAQLMFDPAMRPDTFIGKLAQENLWSDAFKLAALTLPPREAVWWACMCARTAPSIVDKEAEIAALESAEKWVFEPNADNRKKAFELAQECDPCLAGGMCAFTATYHDSRLPLVDGTEAELEPSVFPAMVTGVIMMAAADTQKPRGMFERFERFLKSAEEIANGGDGRMSDLAE